MIRTLSPVHLSLRVCSHSFYRKHYPKLWSLWLLLPKFWLWYFLHSTVTLRFNLSVLVNLLWTYSCPTTLSTVTHKLRHSEYSSPVLIWEAVRIGVWTCTGQMECRSTFFHFNEFHSEWTWQPLLASILNMALSPDWSWQHMAANLGSLTIWV